MFAFVVGLGLIYFFGFVYNSYINFNDLGFIIQNDDGNRIMADTQLFEDFIQNKEILDIEDLLDNFFIFAQFDYIPKYSYKINQKDHNIIEVIVLVKHISSANKYIITVNLIDKKIIDIKRNWKCRKGRGHQYWSSQKCY